MNITSLSPRKLVFQMDFDNLVRALKAGEWAHVRDPVTLCDVCAARKDSRNAVVRVRRALRAAGCPWAHQVKFSAPRFRKFQLQQVEGDAAADPGSVQARARALLRAGVAERDPAKCLAALFPLARVRQRAIFAPRGEDEAAQRAWPPALREALAIARAELPWVARAGRDAALARRRVNAVLRAHYPELYAPTGPFLAKLLARAA